MSDATEELRRIAEYPGTLTPGQLTNALQILARVLLSLEARITTTTQDFGS